MANTQDDAANALRRIEQALVEISRTGRSKVDDPRMAALEARIYALELRLCVGNNQPLLQAMDPDRRPGTPIHNDVPTAMGPSFREVAHRWLSFKTHRLGTDAGRHYVKLCVDLWCEVFGDRPIDSIRHAQVSDLYLQYDNGKRAAATITCMGRRVREFFNWAIEVGVYHEINPVTKRVWPKKKDGGQRRMMELSREGEDLLCDALIADNHPDIARFVRFVCRVPLRLRAVRGIAWGMIDRRGILSLPATLLKNQRDWSYALTAQVLAFLGPRQADDELVFKDLPAHSTLFKALRRVAKRVGVSDRINPTNLRRTWLARMRRAGASSLQLSKIASWSEEVMRSNYNTPVPHDESLRYQQRAESQSESHSPGVGEPE